MYGPYDHIIRVKLPSLSTVTACTTSRDQQHRLVFDMLTELATTLLETPLPEDVKQIAAEESYFGYCKLSDNLMLQALGTLYIDLFGSHNSMRSDPLYGLEPIVSRILENTREAFKGKRQQLLFVENLHVLLSLNVLDFILGKPPSIWNNRRWLISTSSKDACAKSRGFGGQFDEVIPSDFQLPEEYYYAPSFGDLRGRDWAVLIKEALLDAARSICIALEDKVNEMFWLHVAQQCMYFGILYHQLQGEGASGCQASSVTSDELVRCWVAEDLIFSTAVSTEIPSDTSEKQSNYYRSAYEAGKVVIQALQEYSLLPIYSVSTEDVITGVSKLADYVPRLSKDNLNTYNRFGSLRWVSFMNDDGRHVSWNWDARIKIFGAIKMTSLVLRGCSKMTEFSLDELLTPYLHALDLSYTPINSLPPFSHLLNLYLLSLRGSSQLETLSPPPSNSVKETSALAHLENLQVLDMNGVPLLELTQQDGSNKSNLHYLDLSGSKFSTLPSEFFSEMSSLEELIFGNCTNLRELPPSIAQLSNLLVLHVEGTQVTSFPEHLFQKMQILNTLKLINNVLLMSLPMSLSEAKGLRELHISNCAGLILESLWELVLCLEDLHIQTWKSLENIKIHGHPTLRAFSLSGPWIRCLSLRGCSKLKIVNFSDDLTALEQVDLSRTDLEEVPHNLPNLPQLRMLLLLGVPYAMRFPWHQLACFPKIFYLGHCADDEGNQDFKVFCQNKLCADGNHHEGEKTTNTARININDPRMFHSFNEDAVKKLVKEGQFLQSLNVQVKPSSVTGKKLHPRKDVEVDLCTRIQRHSTYHDVQYSTAASIVSMMKLQPKQRHVEISGVNQYPNGLRHILSVTNTIFIADDNFVRCLTDLNYSLMTLEECELLHCNQMTVVFRMNSQGTEVLESLRILQVSFLKNLLCIVEHVVLSYESYDLITLKLLKHIHLEHCPRLEKMFPCNLSLPALETLVILFCSSLKTIFYKQPRHEVAPSPFPNTKRIDLQELPPLQNIIEEPRYEVATSPLPNIKRIYLQELPQLQHIHDDIKFEFEAPNWEKLFVRGCQSFHHLLLRKKEYPKSKVEVNGEREWWDRLQLKQPEQNDYYLYVVPPKFVSRKKHIIESYLR